LSSAILFEKNGFLYRKMTPPVNRGVHPLITCPAATLNTISSTLSAKKSRKVTGEAPLRDRGEGIMRA